MQWIAFPLLICIAGCAARSFQDLGNGTGVPTESIEKYAEEHSISREQARQEIRAGMERKTSASIKQ